MSRTLLAFHAHPDDEALLTGGTIAKAAAAGHRVVLVVATDGGLGMTSRQFPRAELGRIRLQELRDSAAALGAARVEWLGYADSGLSAGEADARRFVDASVDEAASRLAVLLQEESVDVLLSYDRNGGYGHPDHAMVHRVGAAAAALAQTPRVLEARVSPRIARLMKPAGVTLAPLPPVTQVIDVRDHLEAKRAAMRAHRSQLVSDGPVPRNIDLITRLPRRVFAAYLGTERFSDATASLVGSGASAGVAGSAASAGSDGAVSDDIFAGLE